MFKEMRRSDRMLEQAAAQTILVQGEYGILATIGENGYPYGVPVNYVVNGDRLYFHCADAEGLKNLNMDFSNKVCFTVVGMAEVLSDQFATAYESAVAFGQIRKLSETEKRGPLELLMKKYSSEFMEEALKYIDKLIHTTGVYEMQLEHITGKKRNK